MANYSAKFLSNYFSVIDEAKFKELINSCEAEDTVEIFEKEQSDSSMKYGFGCLKIIHGIPADGEEYAETIDFFYKSLQGLIPPGEAAIITEIGAEKLNYFVACCTVITSDSIQTVDGRNEAVKLAADMLQNPSFTTEMDY